MDHPFFSIVPAAVRQELNGLGANGFQSLQEIRFRAGRPVEFVFLHETRALSVVTSLQDHERMAERMTAYSFYSLQEEMKKGFITIEGGHRIGIAGKVSVRGGSVQSVVSISSFAFRKATERVGCAAGLAGLLNHKPGSFSHAVLIGPPKCGKTTLLRDLARAVSSDPYNRRVGIIDERSEIAACVDGEPQLTFGTKVDVLDRCPKAEGIPMLVRSMSPEIVVVDEIGHGDEIRALVDGIYSGVTFFLSAHADSAAEFKKRPHVSALLDVERLVLIECSFSGLTVHSPEGGILELPL